MTCWNFFALAIHSMVLESLVTNARNLSSKKEELHSYVHDFAPKEDDWDFSTQKRAVSTVLHRIFQIYEALKKWNGSNDLISLLDSFLQQRDVNND